MTDPVTPAIDHTESESGSYAVISSGLTDLATQNSMKPGAISPHRMYDGEHVKIRHLVFDAETVLPEHTAPRPVVITVIEGTVIFTLRQNTHRLCVGAILYIDEAVPHSVKALETSRLILTLVD